MLAVSECLLGVNCKYNGGNNEHSVLKEYIKNKDYIAICPEVLGGLSIPRIPCEIVGDKVLSQDGQDFTRQYEEGAKKALQLCKRYGVTSAILQSRSPSCGCGTIYDGTFSKTKIQGDGIAVRRLKEHGIVVYDVAQVTLEEYEYCYETKLGTITICATQTGITGLTFGEEQASSSIKRKQETKVIKEAYEQLKQYLAKERIQFELPLEPRGTKFQRNVWNALLTIPYGETRSYKEIARQIGNEKAVRAVGMANNRNPISIFIPCHRVIGSDGSLVGYGGGLDKKQALLQLEQ